MSVFQLSSSVIESQNITIHHLFLLIIYYNIPISITLQIVFNPDKTMSSQSPLSLIAFNTADTHPLFTAVILFL